MVYFIRIEGTSYVKVGRAIDPQKRLANLSVAHPVSLELVHTIKTDNSISLEKRIHAHLKELRVKGEWFVLSDGELAAVINHFESGADYALNPILFEKYFGLRASVQMRNSIVVTVTEPCFFCHAEHIHGAIDTVQVFGGIQTYGHRAEHCTIKSVKRQHPNGQIVSSDYGYYLWIENPDEESVRRQVLAKRASYIPEHEYYFAPAA